MTAGGALHPPDSFADQAWAATADAYSRTPDSWELAVREAITGLFGFLALRPEETEACIVGTCGTGSHALAYRDRVIERFTSLLEPGFAAAATPPPAVVAEAIGGGIYEIVRDHVLERRVDLLPQAAPDAALVALAPFMGTREAIDLASATKAQTRR
jgi:hypothetical protein